MTIEVTNPVAGPFTPNGVTTDFPFLFKIMSTTEIQVVDASENVIDLGYSVTIAAGGEGGTVSFASPPAASVGEFYIQADPAFGQPTLYGATTTFNPGSLNNPTDRLAAQNIILKNLSDRGIRYPIGETTQIMPSAADRAGKFFAHDADGKLVMSSGTGADAGLRTDLAAETGSTLVKASDNNTVQDNLDHGGYATAPRTNAIKRTTQDKISERFSLLDFIPADQHAAIADGSSTDDHTTALQNAIDDAQLLIENDCGAPDILIPPGRINISSTVTLKSASLIGAAWNIGTRIIWMGDADEAMFIKDATYPGGASWGRIENLSLRAGNNKPATFFRFNTLIDNGFLMRNVHMRYCTGSAIEVNAGWVNCHWEHLRFDGVDDYCIYLKPTAAQSYSSFILDRFTYDSDGSSGAVKGVIGVDVSLNNSVPGIVALENGRIEINTNELAQGILNWITADGANAGAVRFELRNITYVDDVGGANDSILYSERAGGGNSSASLSIYNFWNNGISSVLGFASAPNATTWWTNALSPTIGSGGFIEEMHLSRAGSAVSVYNDIGFEAVSSSTTATSFSARLRNEANPGAVMHPRGIRFGPGGGAAPDVEIKRVSGRSNQLVLATGDSFCPETSGQTLGNSTYPWRVYHEVVATASLPAAAAAMDGTVLIEDAGTGDRNLIIYAGGERFRLDGGAAF